LNNVDLKLTTDNLSQLTISIQSYEHHK